MKMTAMEWIRSLGKKKKSPPIIMTPYGPVTESMRVQAAVNMKLDPALKKRVENIIIKELGDEGDGLREARRRYPEAYED